MTKTQIQWTDVTDNPLRLETGGHWCQKISSGCDRCYAEAMNRNGRYSFASKLPYMGKSPENLYLDEEILKSWARQRKPKKHFVCSMTDWCGSWIEMSWRFKMLDAMTAAPNQTFQLLTKRADILQETIAAWLKWKQLESVPNNIWLGVSCENQKWAKERIPRLLDIPSNRFVSLEPLLSEINLPKIIQNRKEDLHWAIVGGESGSKARPCYLSQVRDIVVDCQALEIPVFVKQLGTKPIDRGYPLKLVNPKGGIPDEWPEDLRIREFPKTGGDRT